MASSIYKLRSPNLKKIEFHSHSLFRVGDEFKIIDGEIIYYKLPDYVNCNNTIVTLIEAKIPKRRK